MGHLRGGAPDLHPCPRGTPSFGTTPGGTGKTITVKRLPIGGCMIPTDANYLASADVHIPHTCALPTDYKKGCLFPGARNYAPGAVQSGECLYNTEGCATAGSLNYNPTASHDPNNICISRFEGCTLPDGQGTVYQGVDSNTPKYQGLHVAHNSGISVSGFLPWTNYGAVINHDAVANVNKNCIIAVEGCLDSAAANYDPKATINSNTWCILAVPGCMDPTAGNYDPLVTVNVQSTCGYIKGCSAPGSLNYQQLPAGIVAAPVTCYDLQPGCLDPTYNNFGCGPSASGGTKCVNADGAPTEATHHDSSYCSSGFPTVLPEASSGKETKTYTQMSMTVGGTVSDQKGTELVNSYSTAINDKSIDLVTNVVGTNQNGGPYTPTSRRRKLQTSVVTTLTFRKEVFSATEASAAQAAFIAAGTSVTQLNAIFGGSVTVLSAGAVVTVAVEEEKKGSDNTGVIVGAVLGTLFGLILVGGIVLFLMKKQKQTTVVPA